MCVLDEANAPGRCGGFRRHFFRDWSRGLFRGWGLCFGRRSFGRCRFFGSLFIGNRCRLRCLSFDSWRCFSDVVLRLFGGSRCFGFSGNLRILGFGSGRRLFLNGFGGRDRRFGCFNNRCFDSGNLRLAIGADRFKVSRHFKRRVHFRRKTPRRKRKRGDFPLAGRIGRTGRKRDLRIVQTEVRNAQIVWETYGTERFFKKRVTAGAGNGQ